MLKQQARLLTQITVAIDAFMIITAFFYAFMVMDHVTSLGYWNNYVWILLFMIPIWLFLMWYYKLYESQRSVKTVVMLLGVLKVHLAGAVVLSSAIFLLDPRGYSRLLFGGCIVFSFCLISAARFVIKQTLFFLRRQGRNVRYLLLAGFNDKSDALIELISKHQEWGFVVVGVADDSRAIGEHLRNVPVVGTVKNIIEFCKNNPVDEVIWCLEQSNEDQEDIFYHSLKMGITFRSVLDYSTRPTTRVDLSLLHGQFQMLTYFSRDFNPAQLLAKRCLDIVGSVVGLAITALLFPFVALAIRLDSPGPIMFSQMRLGENGRMFCCWKFRSMYVDAEERKQELIGKNEMQGAIFKIADDPRVTRVGKNLRKNSIDELLQFWNVFKGEMSLVGTRPPTPDEVKNYTHWQRKRISIKPGITGLWQISGRNKITDFDQIADLDIEYIDKWTFWWDIEILFKTLWVVITRDGAR